jgi:hypothetical protein
MQQHWPNYSPKTSGSLEPLAVYGTEPRPLQNSRPRRHTKSSARISNANAYQVNWHYSRACAEIQFAGRSGVRSGGSKETVGEWSSIRARSSLPSEIPGKEQPSFADQTEVAIWNPAPCFRASLSPSAGNIKRLGNISDRGRSYCKGDFRLLSPKPRKLAQAGCNPGSHTTGFIEKLSSRLEDVSQ